MLKPILSRNRSILTDDAWQTIANSLRISNRELEIVQGIFDDRKEFAIADELKYFSTHGPHSFGTPVSKTRRQQPRSAGSLHFV